MRFALVAAVAAAGTFASGCGSPEGVTATPVPSASVQSSVRPTLAAEDLQPPEQNNAPKYEDVVYDPCTFIDDSTVRSAGFDPETRKRMDRTAEWTNLGCTYQSDTRRLLLLSGNVRFDDQKLRYAETSEPAGPVNGRDAFIYREPSDPPTCFLVLRTRVGAVFVASTLNAENAANGQPCDGIVELAQIIEPTIGAEN